MKKGKVAMFSNKLIQCHTLNQLAVAGLAVLIPLITNAGPNGGGGGTDRNAKTLKILDVERFEEQYGKVLHKINPKKFEGIYQHVLKKLKKFDQIFPNTLVDHENVFEKVWLITDRELDSKDQKSVRSVDQTKRFVFLNKDHLLRSTKDELVLTWVHEAVRGYVMKNLDNFKYFDRPHPSQVKLDHMIQDISMIIYRELNPDLAEAALDQAVDDAYGFAPLTYTRKEIYAAFKTVSTKGPNYLYKPLCKKGLSDEQLVRQLDTLKSEAKKWFGYTWKDQNRPVTHYQVNSRHSSLFPMTGSSVTEVIRTDPKTGSQELKTVVDTYPTYNPQRSLQLEVNFLTKSLNAIFGYQYNGDPKYHISKETELKPWDKIPPKLSDEQRIKLVRQVCSFLKKGSSFFDEMDKIKSASAEIQLLESLAQLRQSPNRKQNNVNKINSTRTKNRKVVASQNAKHGPKVPVETSEKAY